MKPSLAPVCVASFAVGLLAACGNNNSPGSTVSSSGSEVAVSAVSGAMQEGGSSTAAFNSPREFRRKKALLDRLGIAEAQAATWSCTGAGFIATYNGPGSYLYQPLSCTVSYRNGFSISSSWNGDWVFQYGSSCGSYASGARFNPDTQPANCAVTRKSPSGGLTRTIEDQYGDEYSVTDDTTGANTGFDSTAYPTSNAGVVLTCGSSGCATSRTLVINGSHLTGQVSIGGAASEKFWDHTVSTGTGGLSITGTGTSRSVSGTVIVQHNLVQMVSTSLLSSLVYGDAACCFPTSGSISTTYTGAKSGTTETLTFSSQCGEATLKQNNQTSTITLIHCI